MAGADIFKQVRPATLGRENALPNWITPQTRERALQIAGLIAQGLSRAEVVHVMGMTSQAFSRFGQRIAPGQKGWPWHVSDEFFALPVRERNRTHAAARKAAVMRRTEGNALRQEDIAKRIEADQARLRAEREKHLVIEQQKYGLPRRARLIDEMAA